MEKIKVLFVCVHNSARSQMAEALLNKLGGDHFHAESAGLEPGALNPSAVAVMREIEIDISQNKTKSVFDFFKKGMLYSHVITVCDDTSAERCPIFPGITKMHHWSFPDPWQLKGTQAEKITQARIIRDKIRAKILEFIEEYSRA